MVAADVFQQSRDTHPSRLGQAEDNLVEFLADFLTDEHGAAVDDPRHLKEGGTVLVERQLTTCTADRLSCANVMCLAYTAKRLGLDAPFCAWS